MRGPFERLKYDLRRIWECPRCGARRRTDGGTTTQECRCEKSGPPKEPVSMKLIGDGPRRTVPPIAPPKPEIVAAEASPEQVPLTQVDVIGTVVVESVNVVAMVSSEPADETRRNFEVSASSEESPSRSERTTDESEESQS